MVFLHGFPWDHNVDLEEQLRVLLAFNEAHGLPPFDFIHANNILSTGCFADTQGVAAALGLDTVLDEEPHVAGNVRTSGSRSGSRSSVSHRARAARLVAQGVYDSEADVPPLCFLPRFCCGQFLVTRDAVRARPRDFYRLALKLSLDLGRCNHFEYLWHAIFRHEAAFTGLNIGEFLEGLNANLGSNDAG